MKLKIATLLLFVCSFVCMGQQDPQYTQYMYNMRIINPGYMLNEPGIVEVGALYRTQWTGIQGSPKTGNFFASIPLTNKLELGVNYVNDRVGSRQQLATNTFNTDIAYKVQLNNDVNLSFGLKSGIKNISLDFSDDNKDDPFLQNNDKTWLNLGAGMFLFSENYYAGISIPNLVQNSLNTLKTSSFTDEMHLYAIGGYIFELSDAIKLKPSVVLKYVNGVPLSFDISSNVLFYKRVELGMSYRNEDAFAALASFYASPNLRLGYSYDFGVGGLSDFNSGSHEFILIYDFDLLSLRKKYISPRFY